MRRGKGDTERKTIQKRGHASSCGGQSWCKYEKEELKKSPNTAEKETSKHQNKVVHAFKETLKALLV